MHNSTLAAICGILGAAFTFGQSSPLTDIRQLTAGGQNAEAYWSPDGRQLIFQSTRGSQSCDQQYIMNADAGNDNLISSSRKCHEYQSYRFTDEHN